MAYNAYDQFFMAKTNEQFSCDVNECLSCSPQNSKCKQVCDNIFEYIFNDLRF